MGPATTLLSPRCLHDLGAVGGHGREIDLPPLLDDLDGDMVDRLYHETMEDFYSTGTNDDAADHWDKTASTSSAHKPDFVVINTDRPTDEPLPNSGSSNLLQIQPMETVRLRRQDAMATSSPRESTMAILARIEAEITTATNRGIRCKKWGNTHDAQRSWATQKIEEARNERETMKATIEELFEQVKQLTSKLEKGELQLKRLDGICTFRAADLRN